MQAHVPSTSFIGLSGGSYIPIFSCQGQARVGYQKRGTTPEPQDPLKCFRLATLMPPHPALPVSSFRSSTEEARSLQKGNKEQLLRPTEPQPDDLGSYRDESRGSRAPSMRRDENGTSARWSSKNPSPQSNQEKNTWQIPAEGHSIQYLTCAPQNGQSHQKKKNLRNCHS